MFSGVAATPKPTPAWESHVFATMNLKPRPNAEMQGPYLHLSGDDSWYAPKHSCRDVAIRTTLAWDAKLRNVKLVRDAPSPHYLAMLHPDSVMIGIYEGNKDRALKSFRITPTWKEGDEVVFQFASIGSQLAVWLNGQLLGTVVDTTLTGSGEARLQAREGRFKNVDILNLDGLSEAEAIKLAEVESVAVSTTAPVSSSAAIPASRKGLAFPRGQWVKPFEQFSDIHDNWTKAGTTWENDWITPGAGTNQSITLAAPNGSGKNWGVRARYRWAEHGTATLVLRRGGTAAANNVAAYELRVDAKSTGFRRTQANGAGAAVKFTPQGEPAPVKLTAGDEVLVEAFAIDGNLHGRVNGQAFQATSDGVLEQGSFEAASMQMSYRDIVFINLDGLSEAEALKAAGVEKR